tara:strand:- start:64578 stop:65036 length:459 start_codon:yes stop_codon:yes gene_type:complete
MNDITIRNAEISDLPILLQFEQGIIKAERPFDPTLAADPISYYDIKKLITDSSSKVVVAVISDTIVGSGFAVVLNSKPYLAHQKYVNLHFMFTDPKYRGMGINNLIIHELKQWAFAQEIFEIRLTVYEDNSSAIKAYEKAGFKKHIIEMRLL